MKKKLIRSIICFLLAVVVVTECNLGAFVSFAAEFTEDYEEMLEEEWEEDGTDLEEGEFMPTASSYLYPFEEAVIALEELVETNTIQGVIYLADEVTMRMLPEEGSEPVKNLPSGSVVNILGVGQDAGYSIWYRVSYQNEYEEVIGYVPKDYIVCVNAEFMQWQDNYVRSISMFGNLRGRYTPADVSAFPQSYQEGLSALKTKHPNWIFVRLNTKVNWETMLKKQEGNRSWIYSVGIPESWKNGDTTTTNWAYASRGIIRHYMDPRNWFTDEYVFQFELLGYEPQLHTEVAVEKMLASSFMSNTLIDEKMTYAQAFVEIGRKHDVSPMFLAARVIQEQGYQGKGDLISGKYPGYENYYNYFNIKATGNGDKETIENGLAYAKVNGWNSRYKALEAGISFLLTNYIKAGQNTLYLQKFDTVGEIATHQYMQNIKAPAQESSIVYKGYNNSNLLSQPFVFIIPVYENMPEKAAAKPGQEDKITLNTSKIDNLQVDSEVSLQALVNGKIVEGARFEFTSSNPEVAKVDATGTIKALKAGETTITCRDMDDPENPNVGTCKVTVVPTDIDITTLKLPVLSAVTYDPNKTLQDVKLPSGYTWVNSEIIPVVSQSAYAVVYSPDKEKYNPITFDLNLEVKKKVLTTLECTIPSDLCGGAGRELGSVALPFGFYWNDPTENLPDTIGSKEYIASYNPDISNYETLENLKLKITVVCEKHQMSEWIITEATCEKDGSKVRNCSICKYKEELVLEKKGHSYEIEITKEATEEEEGVRTYSCKNCDSTYTEAIQKLPSTHVHKYEEEVTKKASCTEAGLKTFTCSCEDSYTEVVEATGHKMDNGRCQNCGYTEAVDVPKQDETVKDDVNKDDDKNNKDSEDNKEDGKKDNVTPPASEQEDDKKDETNKDPVIGDDKKDETNKDPVIGDNKKDETDKKPAVEDDKKDESDKTPSEEDKKPEEGVKNPAPTEDKKDENNKTPSEEDKKPEEGVKNPTPTEDKKDENNKTPSEEDKKPEEGVKNPTSTEEKKDESDKTPSEEVKKPEETVKQPVVSEVKIEEPEENKAELELMSNLVEMVDDNTEEGEKKIVAIQLNKNTEISQKIVEMAKEHGVNLEVSLPNALKWTIKADSLGDEMPASINLDAQIVNDVIEKEVINTVVTEEEYMELSLSHDGIFGFEATLTIPVEEKYKGQTANLFYFNEKTKELEFVMAAPVAEDGNILLDFNHASDYVIVFADKSMEDAVGMVETLSEEVVESDVDKSTESNQEKKDNINKLLVICILVLAISGIIAVVGYLLYKRDDKKEEIEDTPTFEEWLKEDKYFDDDQDDYREKEVAPVKTFHTGEIRLEEDYLDEEDEYVEKEVAPTKTFHTGEIHLEEDYLDEDVDDYKEK